MSRVTPSAQISGAGALSKLEQSNVKPIAFAPISEEEIAMQEQQPIESQMTSPHAKVNMQADQVHPDDDFMIEGAQVVKEEELEEEDSPHDLYIKAKEYEGKEDVKHAKKYFEKAAEQGHLQAMVSYALLLVSTDEQMAFDWLRMAADHGSGRAFYHLGQLFARGSLFPISPSIAAKCWLRSAALGDSGGRSALGLCYIRGFGVKQSVSKGVDMVKQVANVYQDVTAMKNLAWIYRHSKGVEKDIEQADQWASMACEREIELNEVEAKLALWNIRPI